VEAHGFAIDALVDVFMADAFDATAAQAAAFHDVNSGLLSRLHKVPEGRVG
tara:strand:- start:606 stop:758 length:153 start_codon:yes stop_codon:yes gene_type:complete